MLLNLPLPDVTGDKKQVSNLPGSALAFVILEYINRINGPLVILTEDTRSALQIEREVNGLKPTRTLHLLPDWETLPYDTFSPHQDIVSQRILSLNQLSQDQQSVVIAPIATWLQRCAPAEYIAKHSLQLKVGQSLKLNAFKERLVSAGYQHVDQVMEHGEFALRGSLLDLFPMGSLQPFRLDFFDDELDSIREFDPDTQRSAEQRTSITLLPAHEFPSDPNGIETFRQQWRDRFEPSREAESIYQQVSKGIMPAGIEYYLPLFHHHTESLTDQLAAETVVLKIGDLEQAGKQFWHELGERYENRRYDRARPILPPDELYLSVEQCFKELKPYSAIKLNKGPDRNGKGKLNLAAHALPDLSVNHRLNLPLQALSHYLEHHPKPKTCFIAETEGRREALKNLLSPLKLTLKNHDSVFHFVASKDTLAIVVAPVENGFELNDPDVQLITETDLLGDKVRAKQRKASNKTLNPDVLIRNLAELSIGQPVVHIEHGVGRYQGLTSFENGGIKTEFLSLEYANQAKLYVPVNALHFISRYSGSNDDTAPLHKLGNDQWQKAKQKAAEKIRDVAAELLEVYAKRAAKPGFGYDIDEAAYQQFSADFPFEETDDQEQAITAMLSDMQTPNAMDRLVCGDVGFGKTEVAMRAAFVAVNSGKQVAVLVPTTLLAQQHLDNFSDRFANWPIEVASLSRFKTTKEQNQVLKNLAEGKVDIVIGTHKLLSKDVKFADLGLLVIDEEHRFGVRQKEQIKAMRANVDILTLTATPIPRTLNMAMSGMRDLSIIATPPAKRLAVKTFVRQHDPALIKEAISREVMRGGQVYFLHNKVDTIDRVAQELREWLPQARITVAHGQMRERELERIMGDFHHQRFNVLVCTTIIETGIDIPSANTIIINRADNFGLAQLHQLRGRVGRSHHQAYAYLLTPPPKLITKDAVKRLDAIAQLEDLGAGFTLATHDLEIRGAGELLGDDQSGQIEAVGFTLYMEMLDRAVTALKNGQDLNWDLSQSEQCEIELRVPALLPDDYIFDVTTRLTMYKRIANCNDEPEMRELQVELIDRFGLLPEPAKNLFNVQKLRIMADNIGIKRVEAGPKGGVVEFAESTKVNAAFLVSLLQSQPAIYRMEGANKLKFAVPSEGPESRLSLIQSLLEQFTANATDS
ncbi:transcription-repair coupling factor [Agarivorans sp. TSD2052]|nr:transcription-repair coupling factor [Agarivorans sp. TSD2052]UPW16847.1 transcription-repair coupling factor [Agarivorans sp. TSD2052]